MARVMILCPATKVPVSTQMAMDQKSLDNNTIINNMLSNCPACGKTHFWSRKDAFLEGSPPPAPKS